MSTRLELPPDLLDGRRPPVMRADGEARSAILQLAQLTDRGECLDAAQQAVQLLRADVYDLRLAGVYLVGLFVERGVAHLPELLRCTRRLLAGEAAAPPPLRTTPRVVDTTLQWLFQALFTHIQFHSQRRDETWTEWLQRGEPALPTAVASEVEQLTQVIGELVEQPACTGVLARIGRWVTGDLARALVRTAKDAAAKAEVEASAAEVAAKAAEAKAKPAEAAEPEVDGEEPELDEHERDLDEHEHDFDEHDFDEHGFDEHERELDEHDGDEHEHGFDEHDHVDRDQRGAVGHPGVPIRALHGLRAPAERHAPPLHERESSALASLRHKLHGFEVLVQRGELAKAAIVARDVQQIIERFDPVEFLPSLFAGYFRTMNRHLDELLPHLGEPDGTPWQVLSRLYQADLDGFLDE
jgi:hypothetical protein